MRKTRYIIGAVRASLFAAALAVIFMLSFFGTAVYAAGPAVVPAGGAAGTALTGEAPPVESRPAAVDGAEAGGGAMPVSGAVPATEYPEIIARPFTPFGTGTVVDNATDGDGKEFYTVMTPDEQVFYLVIDKQRGQENVYFLSAVTASDLMALAEPPAESAATVAGTTPAPVPAPTAQPPAGPETAPGPEPEPERGGVSIAVYAVIAALALLSGGAAWYFKIYRPRKQAASNATEYEPPAEDAESDGEDGWGDDADGIPPWDEDEADGGESEGRE